MQQLQQNHKALLQVISYFDIFDYPPSFFEIEKYLSYRVNANNKNDTLKVSQKLIGKKISRKTNTYCLKGREEIFYKRVLRKKISRGKMRKTKKIISVLKYIPTILLIGISGSLAMENAKREDDIDLFIISKKKTLWITRLLVLLFLHVLGVRRKWNSKKTMDTICANMFLDNKNLQLPKRKQNLYGAHEIVQMKCIFQRENAYRNFLERNNWIKGFIPNVQVPKIKKTHGSIFSVFGAFILSFFESIAKRVQYVYMEKHKTSEVITPFLLAFHPFDAEHFVLNEYKKRIQKI